MDDEPEPEEAEDVAAAFFEDEVEVALAVVFAAEEVSASEEVFACVALGVDAATEDAAGVLEAAGEGSPPTLPTPPAIAGALLEAAGAAGLLEAAGSSSSQSSSLPSPSGMTVEVATAPEAEDEAAGEGVH